MAKQYNFTKPWVLDITNNLKTIISVWGRC